MARFGYLFHRLLLTLGLLIILASPSASQAPPADTETWNQYKRRLLLEAVGQEAADVATERTAAAVAAKPTGVTAPEGFAARVNDTLADFLPLFQFAVDGVSTSDDQKSVTLKLNPLNLDFGALALTTTVAEPAVFSQLEQAIVESARSSQQEALLKSIDDFSDLTAAATFGYHRKAGNWSNTGRLYGRSSALYRSLIEDLLVAALLAVPEQVEIDQNEAIAALARLALQIPLSQPARLGDTTFGEIRTLIANDADFESQLVEAVQASVKADAAFNTVIGSLNLDALPALIDNQPQIVLSASHRTSADVTGPDKTTYTISYELGSNNLNEVLSLYRERLHQRSDAAPPPEAKDLGSLKLAAFRDVVAQPGFGKEQRFVFSLSYEDVSEYSFRHEYDLAGTDGTTTPQVVDLRLDGTREWRAKILWTRLMPLDLSPGSAGLVALADTVSNGEQPQDQPPRLSFSLEGVWPDGDSEAQDRVIARLSYQLPVSRGVSFPVSVTYATRDELLGEQDHVFGGHVGITYKMGRNTTLSPAQ